MSNDRRNPSVSDVALEVANASVGLGILTFALLPLSLGGLLLFVIAPVALLLAPLVLIALLAALLASPFVLLYRLTRMLMAKLESRGALIGRQVTAGADCE